MKLSDGLRTVFLAGVGAVAVTGEKAKKLVDDLVKKGELTVEEGKILNEDITRKMGEKAENFKPEKISKSIRGILFDIDKMTQEDRDELMEKIKAANEAALKAAEEAATVVGKAAKTAGEAIFKKEAEAEAECEEAAAECEEAAAECEEAAAECEACEKVEEAIDAAVNEVEEIVEDAETCAEEAVDAVEEAVEEIVSEDKDEA